MKTKLALSLVISATLLLPVACADEAAGTLRNEVLDAWAKRRLSTQTMQLEATIDRFIPGVKNQQAAPLGPLDNFAPKIDTKSQWDLSYRCAAEKSWLRLHTEQNPLSGKPAVLHPYTMTAGFDGKEYRELLLSKPSPFPYGRVEKCDAPGSQLTVSSMLLPVLLWKETTELLDRLEWQPNQMVSDESEAGEEGSQSVRLAIPRHGANWTSTLELDPKRDWLPTKWEGKYHGVLKFSYVLEYDTSDLEQPVLTGWQQCHFDERGNLEIREQAKVTSLKSDSGAENEGFQVSFPKGTHVLESVPGGHLYLVQGADGLESLDPALFQKLPE